MESTPIASAASHAAAQVGHRRVLGLELDTDAEGSHPPNLPSAHPFPLWLREGQPAVSAAPGTTTSTPSP